MFRPNPNRPRSHRLLAVLMLGCLAFGAGCETTAAQNAARDDMVDHYNAGRYQQAYEAASERASSGTRAGRDRARYIAGASAYELDRNADAIRYLRPLIDHSDDDIAGRANATLGFIYVKRRDNERAVDYFKRSADRFSGEDLAHAYYHLALAQQRIGQWTQARTSLSHAMNRSNDEAFRREIRSRIATTGWTLQLNAFSTRARAERHIREMRPTLARAGLGTPRIVRSSAADGSALYLVQVGSFATYNSALAARQRTGRTDILVAGMSD